MPPEISSHSPEQKVDFDAIEEQDRRIGQEQKTKYFFHEQEPSSFSDVVGAFHKEFPGYQRRQGESTDKATLYKEVDGKDRMSFINLSASKEDTKEFVVHTGTQRSRGLLRLGRKGRVVNPLFRSMQPDLDRDWDYFEVGEAAEVTRLRQKRVIIDDAFLDQPVTWNVTENRPHTFRDQIGYQVAQDIITNKRLKPLEKTVAPVVPRLLKLTEEELRKFSLARLIHINQATMNVRGVGDISFERARQEVTDKTQIGDLIIRKQFVEVETALSQIQSGDFIFYDQERQRRGLLNRILSRS